MERNERVVLLDELKAIKNNLNEILAAYEALQAKCDKHEKVLIAIGNGCATPQYRANEALSAGEGEKDNKVKSEFVTKGPDLYKRDYYPDGPVDSWVCKYVSDEAAKEAVLRWNERRDQYDAALRNQKEDRQ